MNRSTYLLFVLFAFLIGSSCKNKPTEKVPVIKNSEDLRKWILEVTLKDYERNTFGFDLRFIRQRKTPILLHDDKMQNMVLISPEYQGRVLTSTSDGLNGYSYGWVNYDLIASQEYKDHMNAFGGEDRIWLGPEGGQFSLFFKPKSEFTYDNWQVPYGIDNESFEVISFKDQEAEFFKRLNLTNYSGTNLDIAISRRITLMPAPVFLTNHGLALNDKVRGVGFESLNIIKNLGNTEWNKQNGMPSIWILGMFKPSPTATVVIPYKDGPTDKMGAYINDEYFGKVPGDRLIKTNKVFYFKADGHQRGKVGINTFRALPICASYDEEHKVLTFVEFTKPDTISDYVNSMWKIQDNPFNGDVVNAYNDGPLANGTQMGPFYEIESSSPAAHLAKDQKLEHISKTVHLTGDEDALNTIAIKILGVGIQEIKDAFK